MVMGVTNSSKPVAMLSHALRICSGVVMPSSLAVVTATSLAL
jgi:hypothetical protein